ncbi:MAG: hypothetical protein KGK07_04810 [Chloroflexota bacterium]|nr:hypothetical protein [Chloroflexota bacterium]
MPVYNHYYPDGNNQINTGESARLLAVSGPTIPVAVGVTPALADLLEKEGRAPPAAIAGRALIDTGASLCMIDESVIGALGIPPFGYQNVAGATGASNQATYPASLSFPGTPIPNITFTDFIGGPLTQLGILALIGRNVLAQFVLVYNGPGGHVSLSF